MIITILFWIHLSYSAFLIEIPRAQNKWVIKKYTNAITFKLSFIIAVFIIPCTLPFSLSAMVAFLIALGHKFGLHFMAFISKYFERQVHSTQRLGLFYPTSECGLETRDKQRELGCQYLTSCLLLLF